MDGREDLRRHFRVVSARQESSQNAKLFKRPVTIDHCLCYMFVAWLGNFVFLVTESV